MARKVDANFDINGRDDLEIKVASLIQWARNVGGQLQLHNDFLKEAEASISHISAMIDAVCSVMVDSEITTKEELLSIKKDILHFQEDLRKNLIEEAKNKEESKIWTPNKKIVPPR